MYDLKEARKKLLATLDRETKEKYIQLLRSRWVFKRPISSIQLYSAANKLLRTEDELHAHNQFLFASMAEYNHINFKHISMPPQSPAEEGTFTIVNATEYLKQPSTSSKQSQPVNTTVRTAASEYFFPNVGFIKNRIEVQAWEHGLEDGCEWAVAEYVANLCQTFVKNILTAMISKKETYKIRDKHFQYGFGLPAPNLLLRNTNKIIDRTKESKVELTEEEDTFLPSYKPSIDVIEQETAFAYACGSRTYSGGKLTVQLLYDTLRDNPEIVGLHTIHSTNLLKLGLQLED